VVGPFRLFSQDVRAALRSADLVVLNLECCVSRRGHPWPGRVFHFRAPPQAAETLRWLGVHCVTLANNHALDFGAAALTDTLAHLHRAGIRTVGAGPNEAAARRPAILTAGGSRVAVLGVTDHPPEFAAAGDRAGVAYADLHKGTPAWLVTAIQRLHGEADIVMVTPHWGPNMTAVPVPHVRAAATELNKAGATLVAGHSAHVFHGVAGPVLYDLGDFIDDYAVHPSLRNDLGLLFLVTLDSHGPIRLEAIPLALETAYTRQASDKEHAWIADRFTAACAALGTEVTQQGTRLVITWR
jgi:poly-gamma-glutamate capsule biosynthesis protein CapA/YwtB (metallophosphatase superfamily)